MEFSLSVDIHKTVFLDHHHFKCDGAIGQPCRKPTCSCHDNGGVLLMQHNTVHGIHVLSSVELKRFRNVSLSTEMLHVKCLIRWHQQTYAYNVLFVCMGK